MRKILDYSKKYFSGLKKEFVDKEYELTSFNIYIDKLENLETNNTSNLVLDIGTICKKIENQLEFSYDFERYLNLLERDNSNNEILFIAEEKYKTLLENDLVYCFDEIEYYVPKSDDESINCKNMKKNKFSFTKRPY